ncbi:MAG: hypothetical protein IKP31_00925 [Lachnospiraceae bacterium]|nr:hypothetical protein [Lachnospiraceae bacterium]
MILPLCINISINVPCSILYESGTKIPLKLSDFASFVQVNILDTTQACDLLECTRQNLQYMVKNSRIEPLREDVKGNLYLKGEVLRELCK